MAVVGPGYVQASALLAAARVDGNLREAIGASHSIDAEHGRCRIHDVARWRERVPAVGGRSEDQMIAVCPDDVKRAVRADRAGETLDGAVVVARKTAHVVDLHGVRPGLATVERTANVNPISRGIVAPVVECSELVERDVTDESVTLIVEGRRYVSGNTVAGGLDARGDLPGTTCVEGIRGVSIVLIHGD